MPRRDAAGRSSAAFRKISANLRAARRPCTICGQAIDYTLAYPDPHSFSVEHLKDWAHHPHLRDDPANCAASHLLCNISRGKRQPPMPLGPPSRQW